MELFTTTVQALGFPAACLVVCGWFIYTLVKQMREDTNKREERMYGQFDKFNDTLDRFNETLTKIDTRVATIEQKIDNA